MKIGPLQPWHWLVSQFLDSYTSRMGFTHLSLLSLWGKKCAMMGTTVNDSHVGAAGAPGDPLIPTILLIKMETRAQRRKILTTHRQVTCGMESKPGSYPHSWAHFGP